MTERAAPRRAVNWALWVGSLTVLLMLLLAIFGPLLAPKDPLQESYIARLNAEKYIKPPFPPFTIPGFPLGSDEFGRDNLSRLLWALRPTLTLVLVVAAVRLVIGLLVGLVSGWSSGRFSHFLDSLTGVSLSVPVLLIALCIIAALGNQWGVWAFILGMVLTGWAESARLTQQQTRAIKSQTFIEAARGLGANPEEIVVGHVLPHVLPLMWVQLTLEISSALLITAGLGLLGYFINAVWMPLGDWTSLRASGMPELGQMLGASTITKQPWSALFAGTAIVLIVMGFNLLGAGLRQALSLDRQRRRAEHVEGLGGAGVWVEDKLYTVVAKLRYSSAASTGLIAILIIFIAGGGYLLWAAQNRNLGQTSVIVPGNHWWAAELHDAQGTYWSPASGPGNANILWKISAGAEIGFGPAVDASGNVYFGSVDRKLNALSSSGEWLWQADLPAEPGSSPALGPDGRIYILDTQAGLSAFQPDGTWLWTNKDASVRAPLKSPIVSSLGIIYFANEDGLYAVNPDGMLRWKAELPTFSYTNPQVRMSVDESLLFFEDAVLNARTGKTVFATTRKQMDRFIVGANGKIYIRDYDTIKEWQLTEAGAVLIETATIETRVLGTSMRAPFDAGVSPGSNLWFLYGSVYDYPRFIWTDPKGQSPQVQDFPYRISKVIGIDQSGQMYTCGELETVVNQVMDSECIATSVTSGAVMWKLVLEKSGLVTGGAIAPQRLYLTTGKGEVYAIGE